MTDQVEIWKDIPDYEGHYQVSDLGRVRSLDKLVNARSSNTTFLKKIHGRIIKLNKGGGRGGCYFIVMLQKFGKNKTKLVHRLVGISFIPNPENKPQINHINGVKTDNRVENLEWATNSENTKHSFLVLNRKTPMAMLGKKGYAHNLSTPIRQLDMGRNFIKGWGSLRQAADNLSVNRTLISSALKDKSKSAGNFMWEYDTDCPSFYERKKQSV